jgi:tetratricopeptide (TPR) repeat protein
MAPAVTAYGNKDYLKVREITARVIKDNPKVPLALPLHGWSQLQLGDLDNALSDFKKVQAEYPDNFHGYLGEAWVLIKRGELERSDKLLDKAEQWMDQHQRTLLRATRGWVAFYRNDLVEAERQFLRAEEDRIWEDWTYYHIESSVLATWTTMPWVGMGWVETARGNTANAIEAFNKGLSRDASCHLCYAGLAHLAEMDGKIDRAIRFATEGLMVSRHDPELVAQLNALLLKNKSLDKSLEVYTKLVKKNGDDPLYLTNLGYVYLHQNDTEQAEKLFRRALSIAPYHELAMVGLSRLENQSAL